MTAARSLVIIHLKHSCCEFDIHFIQVTWLDIYLFKEIRWELVFLSGKYLSSRISVILQSSHSSRSRCIDEDDVETETHWEKKRILERTWKDEKERAVESE